MGRAELQTRYYTPAEYFALEKKSQMRHEYFDGELFMMAGASAPHNLVKGNMVAALRPGARTRGCRLFDENMRLEVAEGVHYTYPDIMVTCDPADRRDPYLVRHPVLIVEVLSPSTAEYDRTTKFQRYQQLASLRHYVLVAQSSWTVEWFRRDEAGQWIFTLCSGPEAVLEIPDLGLRLPLAQLYEDTDIAPLLVAPWAASTGPDAPRQ